ncbi:MAG: hypothetical protein ACQEXJ_14085 [Myxococcota bacterium]
MARPLERALGLVPTYRQTAAGERKRVGVKLALGAVAVGFATLSKDSWAWVAPSLVALLLAVLLPVRRRRREEWTRTARAMAGPRVVLEDVPVEARYDGRKLSMEAAGRQWSVRPGGTRVRTGADADGPWLALLRSKRPEAGAAFRLGPEPDEDASRFEEAACPCPPERVVTLDADGWELILATFAPELSKTRSGRRRR